MVKKQRYIFLLFLFTLLAGQIRAQSTGRIGISAIANYSVPLAGLADWFKPAINYGLSAGSQVDNAWYLEGIIEFTQFNEENLQGYSAGKIDLSLEHLGLVFNTKYRLLEQGMITPYLNFGTGLYYWKGKRGEIQPDDTVNPPIPYVADKVLEEWNLGFRAGVGMDISLTESIAVDLVGYYRFIVGDLWPAMQPHVELENVSGFQTLNLAAHLRYYF